MKIENARAVNYFPFKKPKIVWNWTGLAELFSKEFSNGSYDFDLFDYPGIRSFIGSEKYLIRLFSELPKKKRFEKEMKNLLTVQLRH